MKTLLISVGLASGALLATAGTASAVTVADFNTMIGPTTGTLQLTRFPSYAELACPDSACTAGVVPAPRILDYSPLVSPPPTSTKDAKSPADRVPGYQGYDGMSWAAGSRTTRAFELYLDLWTYAPGTDLSAVPAAEVAFTKSQAKGIRTTVAPPVTSGSATTQSMTLNYPGGFTERRVYAWATANGSTSLFAIGCVKSPLGKPPTAWGSSCNVANMVALGSAVVTRGPLPAVPGQDAINQLLPASFPAGLVPQALVSVPAGPLWAQTQPRPALTAALGGTSGTGFQAQIGVTGYKNLLFPAFVAALQDTSAATTFLREGCRDSGPDVTCKLTRVPGVNGYLTSSYPKKDTKQRRPIYLGVQAAGAGRLVGLSCSLRDLSPMSKAITRKCVDSMQALAKSVTTG